MQWLNMFVAKRRTDALATWDVHVGVQKNPLGVLARGPKGLARAEYA